MESNQNLYKNLPDALVGNVPILVIAFNNATYLRRMIAQLKRFNMRNIIVVDNASTSPIMLKYLDEIERDVTVVKLAQNEGPRAPFLMAANYARLPDIFCITDPDLEFNAALPENFMFTLIDATEVMKIGKAGFAIDISQPELMNEKALSTQIPVKNRIYTLIEWESRFWQRQVAVASGGDPIYHAAIDTTFAVYNKRYFTPENFLEGVRIAGRFTCKHLPWYKENGLDADEEEYYRNTQKWSTYQV